jgi:hypothetical protein
MGHSSIKVTLDLYGHLYPDIIESVTRALEGLVSSDSASRTPAAGQDGGKTARAPR